MIEIKPKCRLYLQLPAPFTAGLETKLAQALAGADIACVLLCRTAETADEIHINRLIDIAHAAGAVCLIEDDAELAARLGADGVHIGADTEVYIKARALLGPEASIGAGCGLSRHDAMRLAEMGADYVAFGTTNPAGLGELDQCAELIAWWAEIFVVPCVAWNIDSPAAAERFARLGADFVAPSPEIWRHAAPAARIAEIGRAIGRVRRAA